MRKCNHIVGIAMLSMVALATLGGTKVVAAPGKAYVCADNAGAKDYGATDQHCALNIGAGNGGRGHILLTVTKLWVINARTLNGTTAAAVWKVKGKISGIATEVQCTGLTGTGELTNAATSVSGTGTINYTGCTVTKPEGRGCVVTGGAITTEPVSATTAGRTNANELKFTPTTGTLFATIPIASCKENSPPANNYTVNGSLIATTSGATTTATHAGITGQGTLTFGGQAAGLEGALTIECFGSLQPIVLT